MKTTIQTIQKQILQLKKLRDKETEQPIINTLDTTIKELTETLQWLIDYEVA